MHICQTTDNRIKQVLIKTIRAVKPKEALNQQATPERQVTMGILKLPCKI